MTAGHAASLEVSGLTKRFGGLRAIDGVSLSVPSGAIFGLIGPNGAGKTTLFNVVTGLSRADAGRIVLSGSDITEKSSSQIADAGVGRTFQNIRLFGQMSVLENVLVAAERGVREGTPRRAGGRPHPAAGLWAALRMRPPDRAREDDLRRRCSEILRLFDLHTREEARAATLPYGDQRRLEIARALVRGPGLLLLDEPAAGMNEAEARALTEQLGWVRTTFGLTLMLVEHNMEVVMRACDQVQVLDHGETLAAGVPSAVRKDPRVLEAYLGAGGAPEAADPRGALSPPSTLPTAHPTRRTVGPLRAAGAPLLELRDVRVRYGGIEALRGVSLRVMPGEVVALVGANGAGKTTTLRGATRLLPLAGGEISLAGESVTRHAPEDLVALGVSLVPEGRAVFAEMSVTENLAMGAYTHRHRASMTETLAHVVALFPRLGERRTQLAGTLSGGEQQMLAIGRALMARPRLLLLDEPSLGIAPKLVQQIFGAIVAIAASGVTILLVEQNTRLALSVSRRAYVMRAGEVAHEGASEALAHDPRLRAAYLGD